MIIEVLIKMNNFVVTPEFRERQKQEAISRMRMLKLSDNVIREFQDESKLNFSERGMLYWLDEAKQIIINKFEEEHKSLVFHVIHDFTQFGELLTLLFVGKNEQEWDYDKQDIQDGFAFTYCYNLDCDMCSEFGSCGVEPRFGGIVRTS